jgi:peptide deformylase
MYEELDIIKWPDPRLKKRSQPIETFNDDLRLLAARMFELMRANSGVGLAAPQVGLNIRMFVMNHSGNPEDDRVYVNPMLSDPDGNEEGEEGCLSIPDIKVQISRPNVIKLQAQDLSGQPIEQAATGFMTRVWQHEIDHLDGRLILDRMGPVAKMAARKQLRILEEQYEALQNSRRKPPRPPIG